jgi:HK97 family phage major capsid protein
MKIILLTKWNEHEAGTMLEISDLALAKDLIEKGIAKDPTQEALDRLEAEKVKQAEAEVIREAVAVQIKELNLTPADQKVHVISEPRDDPKGGFKFFSEFTHAVVKASMPGATVDKRLLPDREEKVAGHLAEGDPAQGGFLVPTEFRATLLKRAYETGQVSSRCMQIPMASNRIQIPAINETSRVDGSRQGGVQVFWTEEAQVKNYSKPHFRQIQLNLHKLCGLIYTSDELLEDSAISVEPLLTQLFGDEIAHVIDQAFLRGTGAGQPLGIIPGGIAGASTVSVARTGAGAIVAQDVINMYSRMWGPNRSNGVWFINQDVEPQLFTMAVAVGMGGVPVYMPANGLSGAPYGTLFGRPVIPFESCSTMGTIGDIVFADFSQYLYGQKTTGPQVASSIHVNFIYDETCFRFVMRVDGQPWWNLVLTPENGVNTLSPFVVLAT